MNFSSIALANLLGLAGLCAQIGTGAFANGTVTHFEALPHMPSVEIGYKITKNQKRIEISGLTLQDNFCLIPVQIEIEINKQDIRIISLHDQGELVELDNSDMLNRALGKLALQIGYTQTLADKANNAPAVEVMAA